jgi:hypothetical protein
MSIQSEIIDTFEQEMAFAMEAYQQRLANVLRVMKATLAATIEDAGIPPHDHGHNS